MNSSGTTPSEEIAIVGLAGRLPAAQDADALWKAVSEKRDCLADFPGGRSRELDDFYASVGTGPGPPTRRGGFLPDFDTFDAAFFGIAPREAEWMDPQQRLLLEIAWEALEGAGQSLEALRGSKTGVFVGIWTNDYQVHANRNAPAIDFFSLTGGPGYAASSRVAHHFDLRGPDISVNAASAASLVAIHLAVRSLRSGESSMALAGGANMIFRAENSRAFNRAGMLAPDGRCKFGAAGADGIVRSEGAGILVLKRLSDALRDGDSVLGLIIGTAVTNSGKAGGSLTTPSEAAQRRAMLDALHDAGVAPASVQYVQAHGTGSRVGDPVELAALASVFGGGDRMFPCRVGSLKSNIGHTESAAGVAGIILMLQAFRYKAFPPTLHAEQPTTAIDWFSSGLKLEIAGALWEDSDEAPRRAAVNGLALAGTNAHILLQEAPVTARLQPPARAVYLLPISAASEAALRQRAQQMVTRLESLGTGDDPETSLADVCYTAAVRRSHLPHRLVVAGKNATEIRSRLQEFLLGITSSSVACSSATEPLIAAPTDRADSETETSLTSIGQLYVGGSMVDWKRLYPLGNLAGLPAYPWQRERFWIESRSIQPASSEPLLTSSSPESEIHPDVLFTEHQNAFAETLKAMKPGVRTDALAVWLREQAAAVLGSSVSRIETTKALKPQGMDSLLTLELLSKIERALGLVLSAGTAWNYPEISSLARYLGDRLGQNEMAGQTSTDTNGATLDSSRSHEPSPAELLETELAGAELVLRGRNR